MNFIISLFSGAKICFDFVQDLESFGVKIKIVNIGGGLSSTYSDPEEPEEFSFANYRKALEVEIPQLFSGKYKIVTEFGRSLLLKVFGNCFKKFWGENSNSLYT